MTNWALAHPLLELSSPPGLRRGFRATNLATLIAEAFRPSDFYVLTARAEASAFSYAADFVLNYRQPRNWRPVLHVTPEVVYLPYLRQGGDKLCVGRLLRLVEDEPRGCTAVATVKHLARFRYRVSEALWRCHRGPSSRNLSSSPIGIRMWRSARLGLMRPR